MDTTLVTELLLYSNKVKALFVYRKCLLRKKFNLAKKIANKYGISNEVHDDTITALSYTILALKNKKLYL